MMIELDDFEVRKLNVKQQLFQTVITVLCTEERMRKTLAND